MKLVFAELAEEDCLYWQKQDCKMVERIIKLIEATARDPFFGIDKPEPLKHAFAGFRSSCCAALRRVSFYAGFSLVSECG